ncbi:MAG: phage tail sheath C-terminal domain-containing protein, partial [Candidatus Rokubacteria bacterium]|nr:phage tail sheath C-terminal domain-containing protein [Candidatus Rokubacteria bacterium]
RVPRWKAGDCQKALKCFEAIKEISIVAAPGSTFGHEDGGTGTAIAKVLIEHAERMRYRFAVLDSGPGQSIEDVRAIRDFRVWGGRTLSTDPEWKYVNVRRLFIYLEASIDKGTQWAVFEPNAEPLWAKIRRAVEDFLTSEWRSGGLPGSRPEEAFFVKCDRSTMTQDDIDQGRLICVVGVAVVRPSEFVIFRIGQWTADRPPSHHKRRRRLARRGA